MSSQPPRIYTCPMGLEPHWSPLLYPSAIHCDKQKGCLISSTRSSICQCRETPPVQVENSMLPGRTERKGQGLGGSQLSLDVPCLKVNLRHELRLWHPALLHTYCSIPCRALARKPLHFPFSASVLPSVEWGQKCRHWGPLGTNTPGTGRDVASAQALVLPGQARTVSTCSLHGTCHLSKLCSDARSPLTPRSLRRLGREQVVLMYRRAGGSWQVAGPCGFQMKPSSLAISCQAPRGVQTKSQI